MRFNNSSTRTKISSETRTGRPAQQQQILVLYVKNIMYEVLSLVIYYTTTYNDDNRSSDKDLYYSYKDYSRYIRPADDRRATHQAALAASSAGLAPARAIAPRCELVAIAASDYCQAAGRPLVPRRARHGPFRTRSLLRRCPPPSVPTFSAGSCRPATPFVKCAPRPRRPRPRRRDPPEAPLRLAPPRVSVAPLPPIPAPIAREQGTSRKAVPRSGRLVRWPCVLTSLSCLLGVFI